MRVAERIYRRPDGTGDHSRCEGPKHVVTWTVLMEDGVKIADLPPTSVECACGMWTLQQDGSLTLRVG